MNFGTERLIVLNISSKGLKKGMNNPNKKESERISCKELKLKKKKRNRKDRTNRTKLMHNIWNFHKNI